MGPCVGTGAAVFATTGSAVFGADGRDEEEDDTATGSSGGKYCLRGLCWTPSLVTARTPAEVLTAPPAAGVESSGICSFGADDRTADDATPDASTSRIVGAAEYDSEVTVEASCEGPESDSDVKDADSREGDPQRLPGGVAMWNVGTKPPTAFTPPVTRTARLGAGRRQKCAADCSVDEPLTTSSPPARTSSGPQSGSTRSAESAVLAEIRLRSGGSSTYTKLPEPPVAGDGRRGAVAGSSKYNSGMSAESYNISGIGSVAARSCKRAISPSTCDMAKGGGGGGGGVGGDSGGSAVVFVCCDAGLPRPFAAASSCISSPGLEPTVPSKSRRVFPIMPSWVKMPWWYKSSRSSSLSLRQDS
mmetsp:Transcript_38562/g.123953  ORF Transcript_38562/g.123953 Transcript_38562/m.123953 type:complete len:360 (-) Transcript_38562:1631-2710(-)